MMDNMKLLQNITFLLFLSQLVSVFGKCIYDEVQRSTRVVSLPASQTNPVKKANIPHDVNMAKYGHWMMHEKNHVNEQGSQNYYSQNLRRIDKKKIDTIHPEPIRIKTWTTRESPRLLQWETQRLEAAVSAAISSVSRLISVLKPVKRLLLSRDIRRYCKFIWKNSSSVNFNRCGRAHENYQTESCLGVTIPDEHLSGCVVYPNPEQPVLRVLKPDGEGLPDTDFLLYVHTQKTEKCGTDISLLAYSAHCQTTLDGRPLAGVMVICTERFTSDRFSHEHIVQTVIHELLHVLGFSKDLFSRWRRCAFSSQRDIGGCSYGQVTSADEAGQMRLYSAGVMEALHTHLNSTQAELGAPLENQDADFSGVSSHWEARVLQGSIMTAVLPEPSLVRIDAVTLSALQDTGWYSVKLSQAQSLLWGKDEGASFGSVNTCNDSSSFFCNGSKFGCHYLHLHKGVCKSDQYLDGCRIYKPLLNASECWKEENKRWIMMENWSGEIYYPDSRCFISSLIREDHSSVSVFLSGRCYRHRCTGRNQYQIQVMGSDWLDCPAGISIKVFGYRGLIFCPDKKLCYYSDVAPPTSTNTPLPPTLLPAAHLFSHQMQQHTTPAPTINYSTPPHVSDPSDRLQITVLTVVGFAAGLFFFSTFIVIYRKCAVFNVQVHAVI